MSKQRHRHKGLDARVFVVFLFGHQVGSRLISPSLSRCFPQVRLCRWLTTLLARHYSAFVDQLWGVGQSQHDFRMILAMSPTNPEQQLPWFGDVWVSVAKRVQLLNLQGSYIIAIAPPMSISSCTWLWVPR